MPFPLVRNFNQAERYEHPNLRINRACIARTMASPVRLKTVSGSCCLYLLKSIEKEEKETSYYSSNFVHAYFNC